MVPVSFISKQKSEMVQSRSYSMGDVYLYVSNVVVDDKLVFTNISLKFSKNKTFYLQRIKEASLEIIKRALAILQIFAIRCVSTWIKFNYQALFNLNISHCAGQPSV